VDARSETAQGPTAEATADEAPPPARQRWRLVLARSANSPDQAGRELIEAWEAALEASALPLFRPAGRARPRIAFGAPIPASLEVERELADIFLTEFVPIWQVREGVTAHLPDGWRLVDLHDVWLGGPALAGQVAAADYRIVVTGGSAAALATAAAGLLAATELPRERLKGGSSVRYDLRPLLADITVVEEGPPAVLRARTRFDPVLGTGRPEEVVAALGDAAGAPLVLTSMSRERLILADEQHPDGI
jgi:radical SAM-linked protein